MPGKLIHLGLLLGFIPPTLISWCQRTQPKLQSIKQLVPSFLVAILILVSVGTLNFVAFYWSCYYIAVLWLVFGFIILRDFKLIATSEWQSEPRIGNETPVKVDPWRGIQILILIVSLAVFGFSMLDHLIIQFQLLIEFGCGFGLFLLIALTVSKKDGAISDNRLALTIDHINLFVFISLSAICSFYWSLLTVGIWFKGGNIISPVFIGFVFGYICLRVVLASMGVIKPRAQYTILIPRVTASGFTSFTLSLLLLILFGLAMVGIPPQDIAGRIAYLVGFILAVFGFVTVVLNILQSRKIRTQYNRH